MMNCIDKDDIHDLMGLYKEECILKEKFSKNCFENLVSVLNHNTSQEIQSCYKRNISMVPKIKKDLEQDNKLNNHLMINGMTYHGTIKPEFVFEAICGSFIVSPKSCLFLNNNYSVFMNHIDFKRSNRRYKYFIKLIYLVLLILFIFLAGIAIFLIYTKMYDR